MKKNIWTFFIDNYRLTYLVIAGLVIFGVTSILSIPKESSPEVDIPVVVITTMLPGASSLDVEELVTDEIEKRIEGLEDLDSFTSVSSQGFSQITATFDTDSDGREKLTDTRERVSQSVTNLPADATDPSVQKVSFSDMPILTLAVTGPYETSELNTYAEQLQDSMERIKDVSQVTIAGSPESQIEVVINQERLNQFGLSFSQVSSALSQSNTDIPIGSIETAGTVYTIRFEGRLITVDDVKRTAIATVSAAPIFVEDIALVHESFVKSSTLARTSTGEGSNPSVTLQVFKVPGEGDILAVVDEAQEMAEDAKANYLPSDIEVKVVQNDAELIRKDLSNLLTSGFMTVLIVLGVLIIFLGWKAALLASLVIPLTFLITFLFLEPLGYTINFLTLFSLILALGILVDASIVVTESIFEKVSKKKMTGTEAAYRTIHEFQTPLISGTLTTIFVFLPMLLMTGIMGKFIESIPITITIVLGSAIFVSLAVIPTFASRLIKGSTKTTVHSAHFVTSYIEKTYSWYAVKLDDVLTHPKKGKKLLVTISILFFVSVLLPVVGIVKVEMFPQVSSETIYVDVENPVGTPLSVTDAQMQDIESLLVNDERVESFLVRVGSGSNIGSMAVASDNSHIGSIVVNLFKEKDVDSLEMIREYEEKLPEIIDTKVSISQLDSGPPQGAPVQAKVKGDNLDDVEQTALLVADFIEGLQGTRNVESGIKDGGGELAITIDRTKARSFGMSPAQVASILQTTVSGTRATIIKTNGEDTDVVLKSEISTNNDSVGSTPKISVEELLNVSILTNLGPVPLSSFASISLDNSRTSISHTDGERLLTVSSDLVDGYVVSTIVKEIEKFIVTQDLPEGVDVSFGGDAEEIAESFSSLGKAMVIGILMIFALLIWQFKSFLQPLFVLATIPLALIGVLPGLALVREAISFPGFIGIVALAGIVVNNAIILIDSINNNRAEGLSVKEAVDESARSRLQPILLTTITTVAGMLPLAFSDPSWSPLAYSIIFGLMFSTVLTLFVIPVLYLRFIKE